MKLVILESPYAGNVPLNIAYAKLCLLDCLKRNEAPIASHLLFTQPGILDDNDPEQRKLGIAAGLAWAKVADIQVFYIDFGVSSGMEAAYNAGIITTEFRELGPEVIEELKRQYPD